MLLSLALSILMLAQAAQSPSLDSVLPKLLDYGVAALAIYVLLNNIRNNSKQDSDQAEILRESIKLNGKMAQMLEEFKATRKEDREKDQQAFDNLAKNQSVFFRGVRKSISTMETVASEVQLNTKATIDHYKASAQSVAILNANFVKAESHFNRRIDDAITLLNQQHQAEMAAIAALMPTIALPPTETIEAGEL